MSRRIRCFESITLSLRDMVANGVYWGDEQHDDLWAQSTLKIATRPEVNGRTIAWSNLQLYPAVMLVYAGALSAVARNQYGFLARLATESLATNGPRSSFFYAVHIWTLCADGLDRVWPTQLRTHTPISDCLYSLLRVHFHSLISVDDKYDSAFDTMEYLLALIISDAREQIGLNPGGPIGRFGWHRDCRDLKQTPVVARLLAEVKDQGSASAILRVGLFGGSVERFESAVSAINDQVTRLSWW